MKAHVGALAILFYVWGAMTLIGALTIGVVFGLFGGLLAIVGLSEGEEEMAIFGGIYGTMGVVIAVVAAVTAIPALVAGFGIGQRRPWARILGIIVAVVALGSFPLGTMFGVFALVVLLDAQVSAEFAANRAV